MSQNDFQITGASTQSVIDKLRREFAPVQLLYAISAGIAGAVSAGVAGISSGGGGGGGGTVTAVTATSPLFSSGGTAPNISIGAPIPIINGGTGTATPVGVSAGQGISIIGAFPAQTVAQQLLEITAPYSAPSIGLTNAISVNYPQLLTVGEAIQIVQGGAITSATVQSIAGGPIGGSATVMNTSGYAIGATLSAHTQLATTGTTTATIPAILTAGTWEVFAEALWDASTGTGTMTGTAATWDNSGSAAWGNNTVAQSWGQLAGTAIGGQTPKISYSNSATLNTFITGGTGYLRITATRTA